MKLIIFTALIVMVFSVNAGEPLGNPQGDTNISIESIKSFSIGKCKKPSILDRNLLQQTWFFNEAKTDHGVTFGTYSFTDYSTHEWSRASYCIEGKTIIATYFNYQPRVLVNGIEKRKEAYVRIRVLPSIHMNIEELTENKLIIKWAESDEKLVLFR